MEHEKLWTPGEVAAFLRVSPKTVTRWASAGHLPGIRTPGGGWRFQESVVRKMADPEEAEESGGGNREGWRPQ